MQGTLSSENRLGLKREEQVLLPSPSGLLDNASPERLLSYPQGPVTSKA